ncbi:hypothetical protein [Georgenia sp. SUBG003]|uniref:hypothetical protein n=1 Tax=Georgenia sp. SUBG003 TaxID=1497974 RepID=UPI003AB13668
MGPGLVVPDAGGPAPAGAGGARRPDQVDERRQVRPRGGLGGAAVETDEDVRGTEQEQLDHLVPGDLGSASLQPDHGAPTLAEGGPGVLGAHQLQRRILRLPPEPRLDAPQAAGRAHRRNAARACSRVPRPSAATPW